MFWWRRCALFFVRLRLCCLWTFHSEFQFHFRYPFVLFPHKIMQFFQIHFLVMIFIIISLFFFFLLFLRLLVFLWLILWRSWLFLFGINLFSLWSFFDFIHSNFLILIAPLEKAIIFWIALLFFCKYFFTRENLIQNASRLIASIVVVWIRTVIVVVVII